VKLPLLGQTNYPFAVDSAEGDPREKTKRVLLNCRILREKRGSDEFSRERLGGE